MNHTTLRSNLDKHDRIWFCIGTVKGCEDEKSRETCDKCQRPRHGETIAEVARRISEMSDVRRTE